MYCKHISTYFQQGEISKLTSIIEKQSTGAATLLISILANAATNMLAKITVRGCVPALLSTKVARCLSIRHLDNAAASVKPPRSSMMTGVHMAAKMYLAASFAPRRTEGSTSEWTTRRTTQRKGIVKEVTNKGMA